MLTQIKNNQRCKKLLPEKSNNFAMATVMMGDDLQYRDTDAFL